MTSPQRPSNRMEASRQHLIEDFQALYPNFPPCHRLPDRRQVPITCHHAVKVEVDNREGRNPPFRRGKRGGGALPLPSSPHPSARMQRRGRRHRRCPGSPSLLAHGIGCLCVLSSLLIPVPCSFPDSPQSLYPSPASSPSPLPPLYPLSSFGIPGNNIHSCYHHRVGSCDPILLSVSKHRSRMWQVALYSAPLLCRLEIYVLISLIPASLISSPKGGYSHVPYILHRGKFLEI